MYSAELKNRLKNQSQKTKTVQQKKSNKNVQRLAFSPPESTSVNLLSQIKAAQTGNQQLAFAPPTEKTVQKKSNSNGSPDEVQAKIKNTIEHNFSSNSSQTTGARQNQLDTNYSHHKEKTDDRRANMNQSIEKIPPHFVQIGETFGGIAKQYNIDAFKLADLNGYSCKKLTGNEYLLFKNGEEVNLSFFQSLELPKNATVSDEDFMRNSSFLSMFSPTSVIDNTYVHTAYPITKKTAVENVKPVVEDAVELPSYSAKIQNEKIAYSFEKEQKISKGEINIATIRKDILVNYNWSGIVKLMKYVDKEIADFNYSTPTTVAGKKSDDQLIVPNEGIRAIVLLQLKKGLPPSSNVSSVLPKEKKTETDTVTDFNFMNQEADAQNFKVNVQNIRNYSNGGGNDKKMYKDLRKLVLARNGIWSDIDNITNVISIRDTTQLKDIDNNQLTKSGANVTGFNDYYFVVKKNGKTFSVNKYVGSTEPGNLSKGKILSDQTLTMKGGFHSGNSSGQQPGFRTSNFLRKSQSNDNEYFQKGDAGMNFHRAHPKKTGGSYINTMSGLDSDLKVVKGEKERDAHRVIIRLNYLLSKNQVKFADISNEVINASTELTEIKNILDDFDGVDNKYLNASLAKKIKNLDFETPDRTGNATKLVKGWSVGCQVMPKAKDFYSFGNKVVENNEKTDQERWYYTIVDISSLTKKSYKR